jgi:hypothetical protein
MKIGIEYSTGNFTLSISGNVDTQGMAPKEPLATTITNGIRYDVERGVASTCYKEIDGKSGKLPKGYKRDSMGFSVEKAARFTEIAVRELKALMPDVVVVTTENVGTLKADALAILADLESKPEGTLEAALAKLGYYGETHGDDGEFAPAAVSAIALKLKDIAKQAAAFKATLTNFA